MKGASDSDRRSRLRRAASSRSVAGITRITRIAVVLILVAAVAAAAGWNGSLVPTRFGGTQASLTARRMAGSPVSSPRTARPRPPASSPSPTTAPGPRTSGVAPMSQLREPDALVTLPESLTPALLKSIQAMKEVQAVEVVDTGTVQLQGAPAVTIGVNPGTFRNFTPKVSASSDPLWQYIARGTMASSFDMARDRNLTLGAKVPVVAADGSPLAAPQWLGAFMSVGLPGIDLVVSQSQRAALKLRASAGLIMSAPTADPFALQTAVKKLAPAASVVLMRPGLTLGSPGGSFLSRAQISTVLTAALSRTGKPYIWGATGPDGFDCSGLMGWAYATAGVSLPRTAAEQALSGPRVPVTQIQPGDLLFWSYDPANPGFIDHVAMYLGNGNMIEAPQTGDVVHVIKVVNGPLVGAVRINPAISSRLGGPWLR